MQIKKPRSSAYIRLVLQPNSYTVYKVDTLSQYVIIDSNRTVLHFATPKAALSMNGSYAILIDRGAVVGQGCSYDGPPTPGITSPSDWGFPVDGVCPVGSSLAPPGFTNCVGMLYVVTELDNIDRNARFENQIRRLFCARSAAEDWLKHYNSPFINFLCRILLASDSNYQHDDITSVGILEILC